MENLETQNVNLGEGAVERFVRSLIADNQLSLARNIVESLGEEYNYLKLEIELKAGNFKKALELFHMLPDDQRKPYVFVVESLEKSSSDVSESMERVLRDLYNENYPLVLTELQRIKKDHPQVVEAVALELMTAVRRGDKRRAKSLAEILRKLDKTHPVLAQVKAIQEINSLLAPAVLLAVLAVVVINLAFSVLSALRPGGIDTSRIEMNLKTMNTSLETVNQLVSVINSKLADLESNLNEERDLRNNTLTEVAEQFKSIEEYMKLIKKELTSLEKLRASIQTSSSGASQQVLVQGKNVDAELASLKASVGSISSKLNEVLTRLKDASGLTLDQNTPSVEKGILQKYEQMLEEINRKLERLSSKLRDESTGWGFLTDAGDVQSDLVMTTQRAVEVRSEPALYSAQLESMVLEQGTKLQSALKQIDQLGKTVEQISKSIFQHSLDGKPTAGDLTQLVHSATSQDISELKATVSSLATKVEELAKSVGEGSKASDENAQLSASLELLRSQFNREVTSLKGTLDSLSQEFQRLRAFVEERMAQLERTQAARTPVSVSVPEDVTKIINETKDLRELYGIGLRYFSNGYYEQAERIFSYLEDRLEGINVHFAEDVYYFLTLTYLRLGRDADAKKVFERYKSAYPSGDYVRELQSYLK